MATFPELAGRVVVITGAANGIGAVTAQAFAAQGAKLALVDIDAAGIDRLAAEISAAGGRAIAIRTDITDPASVEAMTARTVAELGGLDVLVNSAGGYGRLATVEDMPVEEWDRTVALNLRGPFLTCKAAIPHLKRSKAGRIINVASISGRTVQVASSPAYGSAKAGLIQLTRFLAYQLGPLGITSNAVAPITTLTPRVAALRTKEDLDRIASGIPLRRLPDCGEHAAVMLFLASDGASYLNGTVMDTNGGRVMM